MTEHQRVLLVDDELPIQWTLGPMLRTHGYVVDMAASGREALTALEETPPDVIVLDLGLPDVDGTRLCGQIRERSAVPIIVLSARSTEREKVALLDLGADDYMTKPFGPEELLARIRAALRRAESDAWPSGRIEVGPLEIDFDRRRVWRAGNELRLTPKEFELLALLARRRGRVLTHRTILGAIWGPNAVHHPEHLWVLVSQLRRKIEPDPSRPRFVISEPWVGYRISGGGPEDQ